MNPPRAHRAVPLLRRTVAGVAAAVLLSATVAGCGADADTPDAAPTESASTPASTAESPSASPSAPRSKAPSKAASSEATPAGPTLEVQVSGNDVTPVAEQVDLAVGEFLTIEVTSDRVGELHVHSDPEHGFDFGSGTQTFRLSFDKPGSVDIEEHGAHALVARVLVR